MQGGHRASGDVVEHREMQQVDVEMDDIEAVLRGAQLREHVQVRRDVRFQRRGIQANGLIAAGEKRGLGVGIAAGEQGDLMAQIDQRVGQMRHHPFGAAVKLRRDRLVQGRDLGDFHKRTPRETGGPARMLQCSREPTVLQRPGA